VELWIFYVAMSLTIAVEMLTRSGNNNALCALRLHLTLEPTTRGREIAHTRKRRPLDSACHGATTNARFEATPKGFHALLRMIELGRFKL